MNDGGLTILHLSAFFCLFRFYVIWWLLHFNNAACKKRGTKVRGINQIIPIYPSRSEYARKCPKTVSKTSQQTCCLRELRFLDEIKSMCLILTWFLSERPKASKISSFQRKNLLNSFQKCNFRWEKTRKIVWELLHLHACMISAQILYWTYTPCLMILFVTNMFVINHVRVWYPELGIA